ncbi:MAG: hypothetical protein MK076_03055 [Flavobacteriales bacterium]|nr:hypothetical protein [Flavobacteriales bacterium]
MIQAKFINTIGEEHRIRIKAPDGSGGTIGGGAEFKLSEGGYVLRTENENGTMTSPLIPATLEFGLTIEDDTQLQTMIDILDASNNNIEVNLNFDVNTNGNFTHSAFIGSLAVDGLTFDDDTFPISINLVAVDGISMMKEAVMDASFISGGESGAPLEGVVSIDEFMEKIALWFFNNVNSLYSKFPLVNWNWYSQEQSQDVIDGNKAPYSEMYFDMRVFNKYVDGKIEFMSVETAVKRFLKSFGLRLFMNGGTVCIQQVDSLIDPESMKSYIGDSAYSYDAIIDEGEITKHMGGNVELTRNASKHSMTNNVCFHEGYFANSNITSQPYDSATGFPKVGFIQNKYTNLPYGEYQNRIGWDEEGKAKMFINQAGYRYDAGTSQYYTTNYIHNTNVMLFADNFNDNAVKIGDIFNRGNYIEQMNGGNDSSGNAVPPLAEEVNKGCFPRIYDTTNSPTPKSGGLITNDGGKTRHTLKVRLELKNLYTGNFFLDWIWVGLGIYATNGTGDGKYYAYTHAPLNLNRGLSTDATNQDKVSWGVKYYGDADTEDDEVVYTEITQELSYGHIDLDNMPEGRWVELPQAKFRDSSQGVDADMSLDMSDHVYAFAVPVPRGTTKVLDLEIPINYLMADDKERLSLESGIIHAGIGSSPKFTSVMSSIDRHWGYLIGGNEGNPDPARFNPFTEQSARDSVIYFDVRFLEIDLLSAPSNGYSGEEEFQRRVVMRNTQHSDILTSLDIEAGDMIEHESLLGTPIYRPKRYRALVYDVDSTTGWTYNTSQEYLPVNTTGVVLKEDGSPLTGIWVAKFFDPIANLDNWKIMNGDGKSLCIGEYAIPSAESFDSGKDFYPTSLMGLSATACAMYASLGCKSVYTSEKPYNRPFIERRRLVCAIPDTYAIKMVRPHRAIMLDNKVYAIHSYTYNAVDGMYTLDLTHADFSDSYIGVAEYDSVTGKYYESEIYE